MEGRERTSSLVIIANIIILFFWTASAMVIAVLILGNARPDASSPETLPWQSGATA